MLVARPTASLSFSQWAGVLMAGFLWRRWRLGEVPTWPCLVLHDLFSVGGVLSFFSTITLSCAIPLKKKPIFADLFRPVGVRPNPRTPYSYAPGDQPDELKLGHVIPILKPGKTDTSLPSPIKPSWHHTNVHTLKSVGKSCLQSSKHVPK